MISKNQIKEFSFLKQKKYRKEKKKFLLEGTKLIDEVIKSNYTVEKILITNTFKEKNSSFLSKLEKQNIDIEIISNKDFKKLSETETPQGIIAIVHSIKKDFRIDKLNSNIIIGFENINDPGNLGTMLRAADWSGFKDIIISKNSAELYNFKTIRSTMGSIFHLNIFDDIDLYEVCKNLKMKGYKIYCTDIDGESLHKFKFDENFVVIFCNEANGPTDELLEICDKKITIPSRGKAESLNVSSACSIILYEISKKFNN